MAASLDKVALVVLQFIFCLPKYRLVFFFWFTGNIKISNTFVMLV